MRRESPQGGGRFPEVSKEAVSSPLYLAVDRTSQSKLPYIAGGLRAKGYHVDVTAHTSGPWFCNLLLYVGYKRSHNDPCMKLEAAAAVLGVAVDADPETLKAAYRRLALRWHPDKCKDADAKEKFQEVRYARSVCILRQAFLRWYDGTCCSFMLGIARC